MGADDTSRLEPAAAPRRRAVMMRATALLAIAVLALSACAGSGSAPSSANEPSGPAEPEPAVSRVSCGNGPTFDVAVLDRPGAAEQGADPAAAALRAHVTGGGPETDWLPDAGWIEAARSGNTVLYLARGQDDALFQMSVELVDGQWRVGGWGGCRLQPDLPPGVGLATFRIAPGTTLEPDVTEIEILVTEMACNSGQDARGRILPPHLVLGEGSVLVIVTIRARGGGQDCQSNPETPFLLELPEPLGHRLLLDGSEVPPRDATTCPEHLGCP
jgi:hypothetical protein